ncbi:SulP family inorganic anion transporter [Tumebacillus permanentifrigoris]|uniref:SulP family sulfate permease n=1 Tax=Tumebacillus permanentifrigoris TaxID=378543 RepID=A0A316DFG4_9BACL|nr:SulP family inorganic anion transporter [Tumebacillus permanentifrigoris]PWK16456.1 SulP family sulfate permease [Tumebacillus permanentifrigoris]
MRTLTYKESWFFNIRGDILAGMTVAFALIPEAIAFAILAGVDPMVGLYASFAIAVVVSFAGGRPGMISAATGAMALVMIDLVADYGIEYMFAATVLTGILQFVLGVLKLGRFITFLPHPVVLGFVNALAILIFMAQLPNFVGAGWQMYAMVAGTLAIIYLFPYLTKAFPSALLAIIVMTVFAIFTHADLHTVGDMGTITRALPSFHIANLPLTWETFQIILPFSVSLAIVGIFESLLTATILDEMTQTHSDKNREIRGQGLANVITGFFGGMAGCAMIGQSVINIKSGGRGRLATFVAGMFLIFLILVLGDVVTRIPMAALVGVMVMVSIGTFDWNSFLHIRRMPINEALVMLTTMAIVIATHDLSKGVIAGVIISALVFGWKISRLQATSHCEQDNTRKTYYVTGQLFFGTSSHFIELFDVANDPSQIVIDLSGSHVWDHSAVTAISKVLAKYQEAQKNVTLVGLNEESRTLIDRVGLQVTSAH